MLTFIIISASLICCVFCFAIGTKFGYKKCLHKKQLAIDAINVLLIQEPKHTAMCSDKHPFNEYCNRCIILTAKNNLNFYFSRPVKSHQPELQTPNAIVARTVFNKSYNEITPEQQNLITEFVEYEGPELFKHHPDEIPIEWNDFVNK
ncbi:MAG: hypothetical protein Q7R33_04400, partial [Nitrosarchaeum sp.]|nr:hypothetical protein [Nitrosarchaeum sp.]